MNWYIFLSLIPVLLWWFYMVYEYIKETNDRIKRIEARCPPE